MTITDLCQQQVARPATSSPVRSCSTRNRSTRLSISIRSAVRNGPVRCPRQSTSKASTVCTLAVPACTTHAALLIMEWRICLVTKPAASCTTAGVRPSRPSRAMTAVIVLPAVRGPRTTSTVPIRYGGFMKYVPARSRAHGIESASSSIGMDEVFEMNGVPGRTVAARSANTVALSSALSGTASITTSLSRAAPGWHVVRSSPCGGPSGAAPIRLASRSWCATPARASAKRSSLMSTNSTDSPRIRASVEIPAPITPAPTAVNAVPPRSSATEPPCSSTCSSTVLPGRPQSVVNQS